MDINIKATHILEALERRKVLLHADKTFEVEYYANHKTYIQQYMKRSQKFLAGNLAKVPTTEIDPQALRLPFPETYVEGYEDEDSKGFSVVFLCTEHASSCYTPEIGEEYRFAVRVLWIKNGVMVDPLYVTIYGIKDGHPFLKMYRLTNDETPAFSEHVTLVEQEARNSLQELQTKLLHFLSILSCSNIGIKEIEAPKKLNEKRVKQGKPPFFQFKTLFIKTERTQSNKAGAGTHASPCLHWRRGHIRKLSDDRRIWVSAALVGDPKKGFMDKVYSKQPENR